MMDLWRYLAEADKIIVMYGMGNGADKICAVLAMHGIEVSDFFASDGFVRGHSFRGKKVLSYSEICEKYDDFIVLVSFATSLPDVLENIYRIASERELYIPDVPVAGDIVFDSEFYKANKDSFDIARGYLSDDRSLEVFDEIIKYKLSGKLNHLIASECDVGEIFNVLGNDLIESIESFADLGAYTGDTATYYSSVFPNLKRITAVEPDRKNINKLSRRMEELSSVSGIEYNIHNVCAWNEKGISEFSVGLGRGSSKAEKNVCGISLGSSVKTVEIETDTLDNVLNGDKVDFIKYDVEGSEYEALMGSVESIRKHRPLLLVSAYHRSDDLFKLILKIKEILPGYKLYLRRFRYVPAWDINIYAVPQER